MFHSHWFLRMNQPHSLCRLRLKRTTQAMILRLAVKTLPRRPLRCSNCAVFTLRAGDAITGKGAAFFIRELKVQWKKERMVQLTRRKKETWMVKHQTHSSSRVKTANLVQRNIRLRPAAELLPWSRTDPGVPAATFCLGFVQWRTGVAFCIHSSFRPWRTSLTARERGAASGLPLQPHDQLKVMSRSNWLILLKRSARSWEPLRSLSWSRDFRKKISSCRREKMDSWPTTESRFKPRTLTGWALIV